MNDVNEGSTEEPLAALLPGLRHQDWFAPLALLLLCLGTLILLDRPLIRGDGVAYLAWVDSIALDHDVDLANQYQRLAGVNSYQISWNEARQSYTNIFPFGVAFFQYPFYRLGNWFVGNGWWNAHPDYFVAMQGVEQGYSLWLMIGANLMALVAVFLTWRMAIPLCGRGLAVLAAWGVFVASPIVYYSSVMPLNSHIPGAFLMAVFLYLALWLTRPFEEVEAPTLDRSTAIIWLATGMSVGGLLLARWQLVLAVLPFAVLWLRERRWRGIVIAGAGALLTSWPLFVVWYGMFGSALVIPYDAAGGSDFLRFPRHSWDVFRSTFGDTPILLLSLVGLWRLARWKPWWAGAAGSAIILQILINGSVLDWWAGETYGMRRMSELYPLYAILAAAAIGQTKQPRLEGYGRRLTNVMRALFILFIGYNGLYMAAFFDYTWTNQAQMFTNSPDILLAHFFNQPHRWQVLKEVWEAHLGPWAWAMPGP